MLSLTSITNEVLSILGLGSTSKSGKQNPTNSVASPVQASASSAAATASVVATQSTTLTSASVVTPSVTTATAVTTNAVTTTAAPVQVITGAVSSTATSLLSTNTLQASLSMASTTEPVDRERALALAAQQRAEANAPIATLSDMLSGDADDDAAKALETSEKKFFSTLAALHIASASAPTKQDDASNASDAAGAANQNAVLSKSYSEFAADDPSSDAQSSVNAQAA